MSDLFDWQPPPQYPYAAGSKEKGGTSEEAAEKISDTVDTGQAGVVQALRTYGDLTCHEVAVLMQRRLSFVRPRMSELFKMRRVEKTGERRKNPDTGMSAAVWRLAK